MSCCNGNGTTPAPKNDTPAAPNGTINLLSPSALKQEANRLREVKREDLFKTLLLFLVVVGIVVGLLYAGHLTIGLILFIVYAIGGGAVTG